MKILIPGHLTKTHIDQVRSVSEGIDVEILQVRKCVPFMLRILYSIFFRLPFYRLYKFVRDKARAHTSYSFIVNGTIRKGPVSDAAVFLATWIFNRDILDILLPRLPHLEWVHSTKTGVDHIIPGLKDKKDVLITNSGSLHSARVVEFILGMIFALEKNVPQHLSLQKKKIWKTLMSREIQSKTIGIIGLGNIGVRLAGKARGLGLRVIAVDKMAKAVNGVDLVLPPEKLSCLLEQSDYVVLSCPLTPETRNLINADRLKEMKREAYLINMARAELIDEEALIAALRKKQIAGACLDLVSEQPLPASSPLYRARGVLLTHYSAHAKQNVSSDIINVFTENLTRFIHTQDLNNKIK